MSYDATVRIRRLFSRFGGPVDNFGEQALFYGESMRYIPNALTRYRKETIRLIAEMTMGTGALVLIGGTVGVAAFLTLAFPKAVPAPPPPLGLSPPAPYPPPEKPWGPPPGPVPQAGLAVPRATNAMTAAVVRLREVLTGRVLQRACADTTDSALLWMGLGQCIEK
jgi:hypothetical protein